MIKKVGMIVKYSIFGYLIGEGFRNFFKNKKSTAASLIIMCATMFIFGIFFLIGENVNYIIEQVQSDQAMQIFINPDATAEQEKELETKIKAIQYVNTIEYVSQEQALNDMKSWLGEDSSLLDPYSGEENPFKASYVITLTDLTKSDEVEEQINTFENVASITVGNDTINKLVDIANGIRTATGVILVLLILISIFIIANTIKLTVHARRKEISIMKYVGATNGFIRWPFMVEGILIGIIAALITVVVLGFTYNFIAGGMTNGGTMATLDLNLLTFSDMLSTLLTVYIVMGIGIGTIGSAISMRKYLEV
jgi:cell division transport system permease protein